MPKIVKEMKQTAWQQEMERCAAIKLRLEAEDMAQQRLAKTNLAAATVAFEAAARWSASRRCASGRPAPRVT